MADNAPKIAAEERFESPSEVDLKAQKLADQKEKQTLHSLHRSRNLYICRYPRFSRTRRVLDALGPRKTADERNQYSNSYSDTYTYGARGAAESGHTEVSC
jgi:hypothetical protein